MTFTLILEKITSIITLLSVVAPVALSVGTYVYRTEVLETMAGLMQPAIIESLKNEVKPAVEEVLLNEALVSKLDSNQMVEIKGWIVEANENTAKGLPVIIQRAAKTEIHDFMTQTYKVYDGYTGEYIREETGVLTDTGWIILQKINP